MGKNTWQLSNRTGVYVLRKTDGGKNRTIEESTKHALRAPTTNLSPSGASSESFSSPLGLRFAPTFFSWFAVSLFVLISQVCAARPPACQLHRCQGKARTSLCQRQPLPAAAAPHMPRIDINKHGLHTAGKKKKKGLIGVIRLQCHQWEAEVIIGKDRSFPDCVIDHLPPPSLPPPKVPSGAPGRTPLLAFMRIRSSMAVICGVLYQERKEKMSGGWARIIGAAPAAATLRTFNKDGGEEHTARVIHDTPPLPLNKCFLS